MEVELRRGFELATCHQREEVRVGCVVGVCKTRSELWSHGSCLSGEGGFWISIGL